MTVRELLERMDSREFTEWHEMYKREPFGDEWRQTASIRATAMNAAGGKKGGKGFTADEFMPPGTILKKEHSDEHVVAVITAAAKQASVSKKPKPVKPKKPPK